jgi:hypothetical protein
MLPFHVALEAPCPGAPPSFFHGPTHCGNAIAKLSRSKVVESYVCPIQQCQCPCGGSLP